MGLNLNNVHWAWDCLLFEKNAKKIKEIVKRIISPFYFDEMPDRYGSSGV